MGSKNGSSDAAPGGRSSSRSSKSTDDDLSSAALISMALLSLQFAMQPVFVAKYTPEDGSKVSFFSFFNLRSAVEGVLHRIELEWLADAPLFEKMCSPCLTPRHHDLQCFCSTFPHYYATCNNVKTVIVIMQEVLKSVIALCMLYVSSPTYKNFLSTLGTWEYFDWIRVAGIPAVLYALQNVCLVQAYQNLTAVEFNVINQTKTISAAIFCYVLLGRRQTGVQMGSLLMLLVGAVCIEGTGEHRIGATFIIDNFRAPLRRRRMLFSSLASRVYLFIFLNAYLNLT